MTGTLTPCTLTEVDCSGGPVEARTEENQIDLPGRREVYRGGHDGSGLIAEHLPCRDSTGVGANGVGRGDSLPYGEQSGRDRCDLNSAW